MKRPLQKARDDGENKREIGKLEAMVGNPIKPTAAKSRPSRVNAVRFLWKEGLLCFDGGGVQRLTGHKRTGFLVQVSFAPDKGDRRRLGCCVGFQGRRAKRILRLLVLEKEKKKTPIMPMPRGSNVRDLSKTRRMNPVSLWLSRRRQALAPLAAPVPHSDAE